MHIAFPITLLVGFPIRISRHILYTEYVVELYVCSPSITGGT